MLVAGHFNFPPSLPLGACVLTHNSASRSIPLAALATHSTDYQTHNKNMDQKSEQLHHQFLLNKQYSSSSPPQNPNKTAESQSPRVIINNERIKRDEWSEGAVSSLLDAYEAKWALRNRAKLKGHDWEDVARHVSSRVAGSKSSKTQTQCKNKIESMKKRYRSESAAPDGSAWPLYPRLDLLLRGNANPPPPPPPPPPIINHAAGGDDNNSNDGSNNATKEIQDEKGEQQGRKDPIINGGEDDSSSPEEFPMKKKRGREEEWWAARVGDSIRWAAEVVVRSEEARMETMREIERMRAEAEVKRGEMELKRTEIIVNAQLQIAKLFANT